MRLRSERTRRCALFEERGSHLLPCGQAPPQEKIPFHHEMAQCEDKPAFLFFYCEFPAQTGGATPIIPSNAVATHLREACGHAFSAVRPATSRPPLAICRPGPSGA